MSNEEKELSVRRSNGEVEELTADELERINYERKVRDQMATGKRITPKQINIVAVLICLVGLVYALPKMLLSNNDNQSSYVPLNERSEAEQIELLPPLPRDPDAFIDGSTIDSETVLPEIILSDIPSTSNEEVNAPTDIAESQTSEISIETSEQVTLNEPSQTETNPVADIENTISQWASDWSAQDVLAYLAHYADDFISDAGQDLDAWKVYRNSRVLRPDWIKVELTDIQVNLIDTETAEADFIQNYAASNYADQSGKQLILKKNQSDWKIYREISRN